MPYDLYLFDFDYTLADSSRGIVMCFRHVLDQHGYTDVTDEAIKRTIGKTLEASFTQLTGVDDPERVALMKSEYTTHAGLCMTANTRLFPETKRVLSRLKAQGARLGIISTKYRFRIEELVKQEFPEGFFDLIIGGEDVEQMKPSPEGVRLALQRMQCDKRKALYVGDSTVDAETAQAAGVDFAGILHGMTTREELAPYPHRAILPSLSGLSRVTPPLPRIGLWQLLLLGLVAFMAVEECLHSAYHDFLFFPLLLPLLLWRLSLRHRLLPVKLHDALCRRLRLVRLRTARGKAIPLRDTTPCTCLNCGEIYTGNYCPRCGQSRTTSRYHWSNALKNIAGGFFNIDSGFGRTLIDLLYRPGHLMREFIGGKRAPYFRPFQMLFILAAIYIMAVQLIDPEALKSSSKAAPTQSETLQKTREALQKEAEENEDSLGRALMQYALKGFDQRMAKAAQDSLNDHTKEHSTRQLTQALDGAKQYIRQHPFLNRVAGLLESWFHGNKAFLILSTLPLFAIGSRFAFRHKRFCPRFNLTEHLFLQAYIACQLLLISILLLPIHGHAQTDDLYEVSMTGIFLLFCADFKQLYGCSWKSSIRHTLQLFACALLILILLSTLLVTLGILLMMIV